ncbi:HD domain-containing protein [Cronobacter sakazakii]|nr:HD domain-containing protein [Cronobacter sakazakii]
MDNVFNFNEFEENAQKENINYWVNDLRSTVELNSIIETPAFKRLYDISFLGAIDYSERNELLKIDRNRAVHSLNVAGIANFVATTRNYNPELKRHIIAAALLHDIGHIPLSHSAEPYIQEKFGYGHHEIGENLISGSAWKDSGLTNVLSKSFDIEFITSLLNGSVTSEGADIFNNKINADTIDGILRCIEYKGINQICYLNRISIAKAAFFDSDKHCNNKRINILDEFWKTKHFVYHNFINNMHGVLSDKLSQVFFNETRSVKYKDLISEEDNWKGKYKTLFSWLTALKTKKIPHCLKDYDLHYTTRKYEIISSEKCITKRYINKKKKAIISQNCLMSYQEVDFKQ